ncbi:lectin-like domain-containing protein [Furfurilactobacillus siliginis]|uniref:Gram-positive cocci surface proteins LPxTG domain-containing protein n=1 Tax=Furfurilactobacillus siliginis TaxID=348151 RepID=A0A0R2LF12_9LACO|nr:KxYKxGKxW signal peptide domain-containing protein [Furfurilactobacillus siliginis]KRN97149.1 hypothetical protein IV55_GL000067 [Furfurilactobacillus siliginis]GEK28815.1 hypothetical protein LSI01_11260 [Furfurilactobacillus siliginis]
MRSENLKHAPVVKKQRYKMYKAGKKWLFAGLTALFFEAGVVATTNVVHADTIESDIQIVQSAASTPLNNESAALSAPARANQKVVTDPQVPASQAATSVTEQPAPVPVASRARLVDQPSVPTTTPAAQPATLISNVIDSAKLGSRAAVAKSDVVSQAASTTTIQAPIGTTDEQFDAMKDSLASLGTAVELDRVDADETVQSVNNGMTIGTADGHVTAGTAGEQFTGNGTSVQFDQNGQVGLTANANDQVGHANLNNTVDLTHDFNLTGAVQAGFAGGADGISIVFAQAPMNPTGTYIAQKGGGLGVAGLPNALAFVFDTFIYNSGDPSTAYMGWRTTNSSGTINSYSSTSPTSTTWQSINGSILDNAFHNFTLTYKYNAGTRSGLFTMTVPDNGRNSTLTKTLAIDPTKAAYTLSFAASTGGSKNQQSAKITDLMYTKGTAQVTLNVHTPTGTSAPITVTANIGDTLHIYPDQQTAKAAIDMGMDPATVVVWDNSVGYGLKTAFNYTVTNNMTQTTPVINTGNVVTTTVHYVDANGHSIAADRTISGVSGTPINLRGVEPGSEVTGIDGANYILTHSPAINETFGVDTSLTYTFTADPTPTVTKAEAQVNSYQGLTSAALSNAKSAFDAASYAYSVSPDDKTVADQYTATQSYYDAIQGQGRAAASAQGVLDSVNGRVADVILTANSANSLASSLEQIYLTNLADASAANVAANSASSLYTWEKANFNNDSNLAYYSNMARSDQALAASATTAATSATKQYQSALAIASTAIANASSVAQSAAAAAQALTMATSNTASLTTSTASQATSTAAKAISIAASNVASTAQSTVASVQAAALSAAMTAIQANVSASQAASLASADRANGHVQEGANNTSATADTGNSAAQLATSEANEALKYGSMAASAASQNDISGAYQFAVVAASLAAAATSDAQITHSAATVVSSMTNIVSSQVTVDSQISSVLASQAQTVASAAAENATTASGAADSAVKDANEASAMGKTDLANSNVVSAASLAQSAASGAASAASVASYEAKQATSFASQSSNFASAASDFASRASLAAASNNASLASEYAVSAQSAQSAALSAAFVATSLYAVAQSANNYIHSAVAADSMTAASAATATSVAAVKAAEDVNKLDRYVASNTSLSTRAANKAAEDVQNTSIQSQALAAASAASETQSLQTIAQTQTQLANQLYQSATSAAFLNDASQAVAFASQGAIAQSVADSAADAANNFYLKFTEIDDNIDASVK